MKLDTVAKPLYNTQYKALQLYSVINHPSSQEMLWSGHRLCVYSWLSDERVVRPGTSGLAFLLFSNFAKLTVFITLLYVCILQQQVASEKTLEISLQNYCVKAWILVRLALSGQGNISSQKPQNQRKNWRWPQLRNYFPTAIFETRLL